MSGLEKKAKTMEELILQKCPFVVKGCENGIKAENLKEQLVRLEDAQKELKSLEENLENMEGEYNLATAFMKVYQIKIEDLEKKLERIRQLIAKLDEWNKRHPVPCLPINDYVLTEYFEGFREFALGIFECLESDFASNSEEDFSSEICVKCSHRVVEDNLIVGCELNKYPKECLKREGSGQK